MNKPLTKAFKSTGLKLSEVSLLADISDVQLRKLLKGQAKNPRVSTLKSLSRVLRVPVMELGFF